MTIKKDLVRKIIFSTTFNVFFIKDYCILIIYTLKKCIKLYLVQSEKKISISE